MRREVASQKAQVKKAAAPAAKAFMAAQNLSDADDARYDQIAQAAFEDPSANYVWETAAEAPLDHEWEADALHEGGGGYAQEAYGRLQAVAPSPAMAPPPPPGSPPMGMPMPDAGYVQLKQEVGGAPEEMLARSRGGPPGGGSAPLAKLRRPAPAPANRPASVSTARRTPTLSLYEEKTSEELQLEATGAKVVETGFWIWRNVIVPPNTYVVHTRRGKADPVTIGMGKSFRFNPYLDSYLVVPAAMQTIGIFAKCISAEKQGINILAYVQWLISDFSLAYKRLDFSNLNDPMGVVNSQLREQAEAAIKDTVATMTVEQILKDKAPIIQELTERMKSVAEGRDGDGLGLKIVTVQIKEAMIASVALWENLQAPFRHEKARVARLSEIELEAEVHAKGREAALAREAADARAASEIAKLRAQVDLESSEAQLATRVKQQELGQKAEQDEHRFRQETELQRVAAAQRMAEEQHKTELLGIRATSERETEDARLTAERELVALRAEETRAAEAARLEAERALQELRLERDRDAENQRLQARNQAEGVTQDEALAIARLAAERSELAAREVVNQARREADAVDIAARIELDRTRLFARLQAERETENQRQVLVAATNELALALAREEALIGRTRQETANAKSPAALQAELVAVLPELASHMPEIQEYKVIGMGNSQDGSSPFAAMPDFLAKAMAVATSFGWKPQAGPVLSKPETPGES